MNESHSQSEPMTVGQLIEVLQRFDPNLKVSPCHEEYCLQKSFVIKVRLDSDGDVSIEGQGFECQRK